MATKAMTFDTPPVGCPECGMIVDRATIVAGDPRRPSAGDLSVCFGCATVLVFADDPLRLREATDAELAQVPPEDIAALQRAARRAIIAVHGIPDGKLRDCPRCRKRTGARVDAGPPPGVFICRNCGEQWTDAMQGEG